MKSFYEIQDDCEIALNKNLNVDNLIDNYFRLGEINEKQRILLKNKYIQPENIRHQILFDQGEIKIKDIKEFKPKQFICKRLQLVKGNLATLIAAGGSGKTMFLQYLAVCVSTGTKLFDIFDVTKGKVLHIDQEQSENQTSLRYSRIAKGMKINKNDIQITRMFLKQKLDQFPELINEIEEKFVALISKYDLVIIDSLKKISCADENSDKIEVVLNLLKRASEKANCIIILVHHKGKTISSSRQSGRGHSSIYDSVDLQIDLDHEQKSEDHSLSCAKNRDGRTFGDLSYTMTDHGDFYESQDCTESLNFNLVESKIINKQEECKLSILNHLSKNSELNLTELFDLIKGERGLFNKTLADCLDSSLIIETAGKKRARIFSLTDEGSSYLTYGDSNEK